MLTPCVCTRSTKATPIGTTISTLPSESFLRLICPLDQFFLIEKLNQIPNDEFDQKKNKATFTESWIALHNLDQNSVLYKIVVQKLLVCLKRDGFKFNNGILPVTSGNAINPGFEFPPGSFYELPYTLPVGVSPLDFSCEIVPIYEGERPVVPCPI